MIKFLKRFSPHIIIFALIIMYNYGQKKSVEEYLCEQDIEYPCTE